MKKLLLASLASLCAISAVQAGGFLGLGFGRGGSSCSQGCATSCAPAQASCRTEQAIPRCYKTVEVPVTTMKRESVEVPAKRVEIPQPCRTVKRPDTFERIRVPQPKIPQPDKIVCRRIPGKCYTIQPPSLVRYECPVGTTSAPCAPTCEQACPC